MSALLAYHGLRVAIGIFIVLFGIGICLFLGNRP